MNILYLCILFLYSFLMNTIYILLILITKIINIKNVRFLQLLAKNKHNTKNGIIWIHGASVGEVLSAKELINTMQQNYSNYTIFITYHTYTAKHIVENNFNNNVKHQFLPIDAPILIKKFLKDNNIKLVLWLEQDFIPNWLHYIKKHNIPNLLINARMSLRSFKRWQKLKLLIKPILNNFNIILPMSYFDYEKYKNLGAKNIKNLGNLKYTNIKKDNILSNEYDKLQMLYKNYNVMLYLSTHEGEEDTAIEIHKFLSSYINNFVSIIMPRHPNRAKEILETSLYKKNIILYSDFDLNKAEKPKEVLIVDSIGKTDIFTKLAKIVYVGNSLVKTKGGGHNILEPMKFNKPVIFGNKMDNFKSISEDCLNNNAGIMVKNEEELKNRLLSLFNNSKDLEKMSLNTEYVFKEGNKILQEYLKEVVEYIK